MGSTSASTSLLLFSLHRHGQEEERWREAAKEGGSRHALQWLRQESPQIHQGFPRSGRRTWWCSRRAKEKKDLRARRRRRIRIRLRTWAPAEKPPPAAGEKSPKLAVAEEERSKMGPQPGDTGDDPTVVCRYAAAYVRGNPL